MARMLTRCQSLCRGLLLPLLAVVAGALRAEPAPVVEDLTKAWARGVLGELEPQEFAEDYIPATRPYWKLSPRLWWVRGEGVMCFNELPLSDVIIEWDEVELPRSAGARAAVTGLRPGRITGVIYKRMENDPEPDYYEKSKRSAAIEKAVSSYLVQHGDKHGRYATRVKRSGNGVQWSVRQGVAIFRWWGEREWDSYYRTLTLIPGQKRKAANSAQPPYSRELLRARLEACELCQAPGGGAKDVGEVDMVLTLAFAESLLNRGVSAVMDMNRMVRSRVCPAGARGRRVLAKFTHVYWLALYPRSAKPAMAEVVVGGAKRLAPSILAEVHAHMDEAPLLWLVAGEPTADGKPRGRLRLVVGYDLQAQTISWVEFCQRGLRRGTTPALEAQRASECDDAAQD